MHDEWVGSGDAASNGWGRIFIEWSRSAGLRAGMEKGFLRG